MRPAINEICTAGDLPMARTTVDQGQSVFCGDFFEGLELHGIFN
jgi:hypothetical protein